MKNMTFTGDGHICRKYASVAHCGLLFLSWLCRDLCVWKKIIVKDTYQMYWRKVCSVVLS